MKSFNFSRKAVLSWVLSAILATAQTPVAPPQSSPQAGSEQPILRVTTRLIQLNVVAQDRHGNPVTDLTKDDFVLRDAGKDQKISVFSIERSDSAPTSAMVGGHVVAGQVLPPNTFTN